MRDYYSTGAKVFNDWIAKLSQMPWIKGSKVEKPQAVNTWLEDEDLAQLDRYEEALNDPSSRLQRWWPSALTPRQVAGPSR